MSQRWCQISPMSIVFITITALWKSWWTSVHQLAPHLLHWPSSVSPESRLNTITENTFPSPQPTSPVSFIIKFNNGDLPRKLQQDLHFFCPFPPLKLVTCPALIWSRVMLNIETSQELRMLSRSISDWKSLTLNVIKFQIVVIVVIVVKLSFYGYTVLTNKLKWSANFDQLIWISFEITPPISHSCNFHLKSIIKCVFKRKHSCIGCITRTLLRSEFSNVSSNCLL